MGMPRVLDIQERVAQLKAFQQRECRAPSYAELARLFGYGSKNAAYKAVDNLVKAGYLERYGNGRLGYTAKLLGGVALLGAVQAGFPSPAEEELLDVISLDQYLIANLEATFLLRVSGDSMIDAGIQPGDLVLVEKGRRPQNGDIVIAQVDGEWTMKFYGSDAEGAYLDPANPKYKRIRPSRSWSIEAVVTAVVRKYK